MNFIEENLGTIKETIGRACEKADRPPDDVTIVAVSKFVEVDRIRQALAAGITVLGENRVQEAAEKYALLDGAATAGEVAWHMVGHLQTNKVKKALEIFSMIQSVDSAGLADEIERRAAGLGKVVDLLVEVNTSGEETKFGVEPGRTIEFVKSLFGYQHVAVQGLMTIGPNVPDQEAARHSFRMLRNLRKEAEDFLGRSLPCLSMGMSGDFEAAVEEGSTMVRIGTALFGFRDGRAAHR